METVRRFGIEIMQHPQLLIMESDGRLAAELRELANKKHRWALREPRQQEACLRLLRQAGPAVFVIKVGRDVEQELALLEKITWRYPDTRIVAFGDVENPTLADLIWDIGAGYVLFPPQPVERLKALVESLMLSFPKSPLPPLPSVETIEEDAGS
jgi:DNA-binding NarL/FixJ family response regulator